MRLKSSYFHILVFLGFFLVFSFILPGNVFAVDYYYQSFDTLSLGSISGQDGWSGGAVVNNEYSVSSPNSVYVSSSVSGSKGITIPSHSFLHFIMRESGVLTNSIYTGFGLDTCFIVAKNGNYYFTTNDSQNIISSFTPILDTWTSVDIERLNTTCRVRVNNGAWSTYYSGAGAPASIGFSFTYTSSAKIYFDNVLLSDTVYIPPSVIEITPPGGPIQAGSSLNVAITNNGGYNTLRAQITNTTTGYEGEAESIYNFATSTTSIGLDTTFSFDYGTSTITAWLSVGGQTGATTTATYFVSTNSPLPPPADTFTYADCDFQVGTFGFGYLLNGICDILVWVVAPSQQSISLIQSIPEKMKTKMPFAYFYSLKDTLESASSGTTTTPPTITVNAGVLGSITVFNGSSTIALMGSTNYSIFRSLMIYGSWLIFALYVYARIIHLL